MWSSLIYILAGRGALGYTDLASNRAGGGVGGFWGRVQSFYLGAIVRVNKGGSRNIVNNGNGDFYIANRVVQRHDISILYSL